MSDGFTQISSKTFVLAQDSIDTDQIIPARFLTTTSREGLGKHAFHDWRYDDAGKPNPHPLNALDAGEYRVLVAGDNFACGSSREHAPWALLDYGFKAVISTSIADIFTSNALKNGFVPITVDADTHAHLIENPGAPITIDLETCQISFGNHAPVSFSLEPFARRCLIDGVDALGWLIEQIPDIEAFERRQAQEGRP